TITRVLPDLLTLGYYRHPWLGIVYAYELSPGLSQRLGLTARHGLLLVRLYPQSPLAMQGLHGAQRQAILGNRRIYLGGDVLTSVDEHDISSLDDLRTYLETRHKVGDAITVGFMRNGQKKQVRVTLGEEPRN
ncbi:MAG TPA: PDZ domain-containing protein, partial [Trueperaceae bacterium]